MTNMAPDAGAGSGKPERREQAAEQPVLPDVTEDERDVGWGDERSARDDEWYLRERPPHHG
jgi:hypothetical protein